ncbi:hypothetical protein AMTRI_Chr05g71040 [Amborella trichopoda]
MKDEHVSAFAVAGMVHRLCPIKFCDAIEMKFVTIKVKKFYPLVLCNSELALTRHLNGCATVLYVNPFCFVVFLYFKF